MFGNAFQNLFVCRHQGHAQILAPAPHIRSRKPSNPMQHQLDDPLGRHGIFICAQIFLHVQVSGVSLGLAQVFYAADNPPARSEIPSAIKPATPQTLSRSFTASASSAIALGSQK